MNFLLDHDVPIEAARLLRREGHQASRLIEVLPVTTLDPDLRFTIYDLRAES